MKWLIALLLALAAFTGTASQKQAQPRLWWVFLETGPTALPKDEAAVAAMQKGHLDNFKRLFKEGKLVTAGPLADPSGKKRGILVMRATSEKELLSFFEPDEYVAKGHMKAVISPAKERTGVNKSGIDENQIVETRIVMITKKADTNVSRDVQGKADQHLKAVLKEFGGSWYQIEKGNLWHVLLLPTKDTEAVNKALASFPLKDKVEFAVWPQWISKGTLPNKKG